MNIISIGRALQEGKTVSAIEISQTLTKTVYVATDDSTDDESIVRRVIDLYNERKIAPINVMDNKVVKYTHTAKIDQSVYDDNYNSYYDTMALDIDRDIENE